MPDGSNLALQLTDLSDEIAMIIRDAVAPLRQRIAALEERVAEISATEPGPPGKSVEVEKVVGILLPQLEAHLEPLLAAQIKHGKDGKDGKDGVNLADCLIADNHLILTLGNGEIRKLGKVVGSDGKDASLDEINDILDLRDKRLKFDLDAALFARAATFTTATDNLRAEFASVRASIEDKAGSAELTPIEERAGELTQAIERVTAEIASVGEAVALKADYSSVMKTLEDIATVRVAVESKADQADVARIEETRQADLEQRDERLGAAIDRVLEKLAEGLAEKVGTETVEAMRADAQAMRAAIDTELAIRSADFSTSIGNIFAEVEALREVVEDRAPLKMVQAIDSDIKGQVRELAEITGRKIDADALGERVLEVVAEAVPAAVTTAIEALPRPADGHTPTAEELEPLIATKVLAAVRAHAEANPPPPPPISVVDQAIDQEGDLLSIFSDASVKRVGRVRGRDGRDADQAALIATIEKTLASWPRPRDGIDGLGFDDFTAEYDGERTVTLVFRKDDRERKFPIVFPFPLYRGIYRPETAYTRGDTVTFGGGLFHAEHDHPVGKPEEEKGGWRLAVKKGLPGAPGKNSDESRLKTVETSMLALQRRFEPIERRFAMLPP